MLAVQKSRGKAHLLILVGEEELEYVTAGNNRVPAHPGHPPLQPLHTHLNKLFFKTPWNRRGGERGTKKQKIKQGKEDKGKKSKWQNENEGCNLGVLLSTLISLQPNWSVPYWWKTDLPVTCLSGKEGIGMADPNLSRSLSYNQSKCLYLWLTGLFVVCKKITWSYIHYNLQRGHIENVIIFTMLYHVCFMTYLNTGCHSFSFWFTWILMVQSHLFYFWSLWLFLYFVHLGSVTRKSELVNNVTQTHRSQFYWSFGKLSSCNLRDFGAIL